MTKDITGPNGAPAFSNPKVIGIVEQAQNGVNDPTIAASIFPKIPRLDSHDRNLSWGIYMSAKETRVLIPRNSTVNSAVMRKKNSAVFVKEFILAPVVDAVNLSGKKNAQLCGIESH